MELGYFYYIIVIIGSINILNMFLEYSGIKKNPDKHFNYSNKVVLTDDSGPVIAIFFDFLMPFFSTQNNP